MPVPPLHCSRQGGGDGQYWFDSFSVHRLFRTDLGAPTGMTLRISAFLFAVAGTAFPVSLPAQRPLNLDFETPSVAYATRPWGWTLGWSAFAAGPAAEFALDTVRASGAYALRISAADTGQATPVRGIVLQLPGEAGHGKTLRLTGLLRTRDLTGRAMVLLEAWGDRATIRQSIRSS